MGICGLKGNFSLVSHPQEEEKKHRHRRSQLKTRKKINADYSQLPNEIKHQEHANSHMKGQQKEQKQQQQQQHLSHAGLKNLGNTCFINAALQCLLNVQPLSDYFLSEAHLAELNLENPMGSKGRITSVLAQIINQIAYEDTQFIVPENFLKVIRDLSNIFGNGSQQDSQEFLIFLLDYLHEDLNRVKIKPYIVDKEYSSNDSNQFEGFARESWQNYLLRNKSIVVDLFQGQLKSTLRCLECDTVTHKFETFMYLSVPVPNHLNSSDLSAVKIEDCIADFTKEELLDPSEQWCCTKCLVKTQSIKKIDLWKTPNILIVHLKRFQYTKDSFGEKVNTLIDFKLKEFDLSKNVAGKEKHEPVFDLFAVCNHQGSLWGGHYTACAKNWETDEWFNFDDSKVTPLLSENPEKQLVSSQAYVLFYCKTTVDRFQRQTLSHPENWPHFNMSNGISNRKLRSSSFSGSQRGSIGKTFSTLAISKQALAGKDDHTFHASASQNGKCDKSYSEQESCKEAKDLLKQELQSKDVDSNNGLGLEKSLDNKGIIPKEIESRSQIEMCNQLEKISVYQKMKVATTTPMSKMSEEIRKVQIPGSEKSQGQGNLSIIPRSAVDKISEYQPAGLLTGIRSKRMSKRKSNVEGISELKLPVNEVIDCNTTSLVNQSNHIAGLTSSKNPRIEQNQEPTLQMQQDMVESLETNQLENKVDQDDEKQLRTCILKDQSVDLKIQESPCKDNNKIHEDFQLGETSLQDNLDGKSDFNDQSSYLTSHIQQHDILLNAQNITSLTNRFSESDKEIFLCESSKYQHSKKDCNSFYNHNTNVQISANRGLQSPQSQHEYQGRQRSSTFLPSLEESNRNLKTDDSSGKLRSRYFPDFSQLTNLRRSSESNKDSWSEMLNPDRSRTITDKGSKTAEKKKIIENKTRTFSRQNTYETGSNWQNTKNHQNSMRQVNYDSSSGSLKYHSNLPQNGLHYHLNDLNNYKKLVALETLKKINNDVSFMSHSNSSSYSSYSNNKKQENFQYPNLQSSSQVPNKTSFSSSSSSTNHWINHSSRLSSEPQHKRTESASYSTAASTFDQPAGRVKPINQGLATAKVFSNAKNFSNSDNLALIQNVVNKKPPLLPRSNGIH